ncbi:hypothetical protein EDD21DRAFT_243480 [Dissophora ornata]|nr:hypothetical protein EDD21DRAFT_243480 [Dissophora ornata]
MVSSTALSHTPTMSPSATIEGVLVAATDMPPTSSCPAAATSISPPASPRAKGQDQASLSKTKAIPRTKPRSPTIDPLMFASLATPFASERPSTKMPQSPRQQQQKHQRQHSAEQQQQQQHTTYSSGSSSSSSSSSFHKELQYHFSLFGRRHLRQHSHPQISSSLSSSSVTLSPGPTATTLAQSPHRRQNTISAHQQLSSPLSAVSAISQSPSPSTSNSASASPRYHVDNCSNTTATTLPPLPFFAPLPFSSDQKHNHHQQHYQDEPLPLPIPTTIASGPQQQQQQQQQHNQGPFFDPVNATISININSANTNTNRHLHLDHIFPQTTNNDTLPPSSPPLSAMLTAHSGGSGGANAASLNAIPIPTRAGVRNNHINNSSHSNSLARIFSSKSNSTSRNHYRRNSNSQVTSTSRAQLLTLDLTEEGSSVKSESSYLSSRRSSKDSG